MTTKEKENAIERLSEIQETLQELSDETADLVRENFPHLYDRYDSYQAFNFGTSSNPYDKTFEKLMEEIENDG